MHFLKGEIVELRNDAKFISRLLAIGESREVDMKNLMSHSLRKFPHPFATIDSELVKSAKCKLLHELVDRVTDAMVETSQTSGALLLDAMAMLQAMKYIPQTFGELAERVLQMILKCARVTNVARVDFVSDRYLAVSPKTIERNKRAVSGVTQIRIGGSSQKVPRQFKKFLGLGENKESLLEFLFQHLCSMRLEVELSHLELYFSHGQICHRFYVEEGGDVQVEGVPGLFSDHEEADTRLILHAKHASMQHQVITIQSPDTDVFVLMLGHKEAINAQLYFDTGSGNHRRLFDVNKCHNQLGASFCDGLIGFHAFTGCDSTSSFYCKGKTTILKVLDKNPEFLPAFQSIGTTFTASPILEKEIEKFVCLLYQQKQVDDVNLARYNIFRLGKYSERDMPCTKDVLKKHLNRVTYQAAIWRRALTPINNCPNITEHGWLVDSEGNVSIDWMDLPPAPDGILENVQCACKTGCTSKRCSCYKASLQCTSICRCDKCLNVSEEGNQSNGSETDVDDIDEDDFHEEY